MRSTALLLDPAQQPTMQSSEDPAMSGSAQPANNTALYTISDDATLLKAFSHGDDQAFSTLASRYQRLVRNACRRQVQADDVDDCVQAVFLVLARRPAAAQRASALPAWLHRVCHFVCRDARRAAKKRVREMNTLATNEAALQTENSELDTGVLAQLDAALLKLSDQQRAAVMLQAENKTTQEIAQQLSVSVANAYKLTERGINALRKQFARRGKTVGAASLLTCIGYNFSYASAPTQLSSPTLLALSNTTTASRLAEGASMYLTLATVKTTLITIGLGTVIGASGLIAADVTLTPVPKDHGNGVVSEVVPVGGNNLAGENVAVSGITVKAEEITAKELVAKVAELSGETIVIDDELGKKVVTYEANEKPLLQVLNEIASKVDGTLRITLVAAVGDQNGFAVGVNVGGDGVVGQGNKTYSIVPDNNL